MLSVRPKVAELNVVLFGRWVHPEYFEVCASRKVDRESYSIELNITNDGHLVTFRHDSWVVSEVAAAAMHPLPEQYALRRDSVHAQQGVTAIIDHKIEFETEFQLETMSPQSFFALSQQPLQPKECEGMLHRFQPNGRIAFGAISYLNVQTWRRHVRIRAFHTYPDSLEILKSQSTFRLLD